MERQALAVQGPVNLNGDDARCSLTTHDLLGPHPELL